ncbi:MAG: gliding motility-associated C-terminal domain-containing protein, partial [Chitinophagales bacterium]|nr:gliding motility-associated C-terminal domain-containing protein [Chitinophagales bacterium]
IAAEASQATATACGSYHWAAGDTTITNSGVYTARYLNQYGCDSTITLSLNIAPEYDIQKQEEACGNYTWPVTKERYTATGIYSQLLKTVQGCDSLITLDLTIHPEFEFHDTVSTTSPYYWPLNGQTYDQSGVYTELFRTEASCDSIHVLHLRVSYNTDIYFPNVITGEGSNGYFTGYSTTKGTQIRSLSVFDRWGNRVFHREHFATNEPEAGWDGKFGGKDVVPGVYIWTAQIVHSDGREETFSGDVTLVR